MTEVRNFKHYPDILTVSQLAKLLGVSKKTAYKILADKKILCIKIGRAYKIPKRNVMKYLYVN